MPRVTFEEENRVAVTNYDYPKLKLKNGERARILVGLENPVMEFVHTLRKPQIINGVPQMETKERKDKSTYEDYKTDFITKAICLGDAEILKTVGADPKNCPMCKLAKDFPDYAQEPQRRYAMHVIRYRTKAGTTTLQTPYSVEVLVWGFADKVFNKLIDAKKEWTDLRKHDLLLGPCSSENFQQFDIAVAANAEWLGDKERQTMTALSFRENQIPDLTIACGSPKQLQWVQQDIAAVMEAWNQVKGVAAQAASTEGLEDDLNGLLDGIGGVGISDDEVNLDTGEMLDELPDVLTDDLLAGIGDDPAEEPVEEPAEELAEEATEETSDDLLAGLEETKVAEPVKKAPAKAATKAPAKAAAEPAVDNFDDLLAGLV